MIEVLFWLAAIGLAAWLGFHMGVRRERGRQMRYEAVSRIPSPKPKEGVRLKRIIIRR